jgi:transcriptional regulator with XRE-family HTH domain
MMSKKEPVTECEMKMMFKRGLGKAIKKARAGREFTQKVLAKKVGIKPAYLSQIETGRRSPSSKLLHKLAFELEVPPSRLIMEAEFHRDGKSELFYALVRVVEQVPNIDKLLDFLVEIRTLVQITQNMKATSGGYLYLQSE